MNVEEIMTQPVVSVRMDATLSTIQDKLEQNNFHHLLVVESKKLLGIISDRDVLQALSPNLGTKSETAKDVATLNKRAHQIMTRKLITLPLESDIFQVADIFRNNCISCIPIVDEDNMPHGMVSWRDLLKVIKRLD